ncbi:hypothetical protein HYE59_02580 [Aggregatibacter actinomycetemcomitans]|uniref:hypothetical protein n=1 Tax=Aggregatibacter actinomycetemcomitans TaxID=714 RepID=UPI00197B5635|nr:hypothetical protein [Aggregatibacter actinomycetemcomitans]MBN6076446.1 hypothetical protein [Aggregatibacter actinomycetemcomitans]
MFLKDTEQNQALEGLKESAYAVLNEFNAIQDNLTTISNNIDRNKKMIAALEVENSELQGNIDSMTATNAGEIDFSHFDEYSDKINSNSRKITAIKRIVANTEVNKELIILTDYHDKAEDLKRCYSLFFDAYFDGLMNELGREFVPGMNLLFKIFRNSTYSETGAKNGTDIRDQFLNVISEHFKDKLTDIPASEMNIEGYSVEFYTGDTGYMQRESKIRDLTKLLGRENNS